MTDLPQTDATTAALLTAAMDEFSEKGFLAAEFASVAERAGVAVAELTARFATKEDLFEGVIRNTLLPAAEVRDPIFDTGAEIAETFRRSMLASIEQLQSSGRLNLIFTVLTEGLKEPRLVEIYIGAIIEPIVRHASALGWSEASVGLDAIRRFPQLIFAPVLAGVIWNRFMEHYPKVDLVEIAGVQLDLILGPKPGAED